VARGTYAIGTPILPVSQMGGLSCVPFVRMATGMNISGDARAWWYNAAGAYHRGQQPERGAVLAFMGSGGMSRGHVAVVSRVVNARTIQIDHSNWGGPGLRRGQVVRGATVVDVSDRNDWTAVRVQVGYDNDTFGRTYPTHGFIYNRPAGGGTIMASTAGLTEIAQAPSPHARLHLIRATEALAD
jgi:surface antigen